MTSSPTSTPPVSSATFQVSPVSIHAFRGEGDPRLADFAAAAGSFNPRLPGGRRLYRVLFVSIKLRFQSTPSGGKATRRPDIQRRPLTVSIHAFRGEGDSGHTCSPRPTFRFNPRLPGGRRPSSPSGCAERSCFNPRLPGGRRLGCGSATSPRLMWFQSTPSGGKATVGDDNIPRDLGVSIHAFRGEGD